MPARHLPSRRREYRSKKDHKRRFNWKIVKILVLLLLPVFILVAISATTKFWDGKHKLAIAIPADSGDVEVAVFDPSNGNLTVVGIPASTEVSVARNLGKWRIKSVSRLGEKEGLGGALLAETITRHFSFPVFLWGQEEARGFANGDLKDLLKATFSPYQTNLGFGDRVQLFIFSLSVRNSKKEIIQLADTRYLKQTILSDGETGYEISGSLPADLAAVFSEPDFTGSSGRTRVIDQTGDHVAGDVASVAQVLGLKVVSIGNESKQKIDCEVVGKDEQSVELLARIWGCRQKIDSTLDLDLIMTIGEDFAKRY
ncbi:hypothetical protein HYT59_02315 [Candidatus Woesebacteria bacterium]|nr:hypothetical protein [Candidatus Woesebacteria bacterium]